MNLNRFQLTLKIGFLFNYIALPNILRIAQERPISDCKRALTSRLNKNMSNFKR